MVPLNIINVKGTILLYTTVRRGPDALPTELFTDYPTDIIITFMEVDETWLISHTVHRPLEGKV